MYKWRQKKTTHFCELFFLQASGAENPSNVTVHFKSTAWGGVELDPSKEFIVNNLSRGSGLFCLWAVGKQVMGFLRAWIQWL